MINNFIAEMDLSNIYDTRIRINASVVNEIATLKKKDKARFDSVTEESAEEEQGHCNIKKPSRLWVSLP